jgi:chromosome partitioning protein
MTVIAISNQKGGVGKTTITFNLAQILSSKRGIRVLVIDNDPQGNLTASFLDDPAEMTAATLGLYDGSKVIPIEINENLFLIGSDISLSPVAERDFQAVFKLKESISRFKTQFGYILIDCLPSFGHLNLAALNAADYVLIPVKPSPFSLLGMQGLLSTIDKAKKYFNPALKVVGIIINQADGRNLVIEKEMEHALRQQYKNLVFKSKINKRVRIEESSSFHRSITEYDSKGPSAREFKDFARELVQRINDLK